MPSKLRVSARYLAAPSSMVVCPSWPQACIFPGTVEAWATPLCSRIGSASMSARRPMARDVSPWPRMTPTTPVLAMPVTTSSQPNSRSFSATMPAVRTSSKAISGWAWKSCRQAVISAWKSAMRFRIGMWSRPGFCGRQLWVPAAVCPGFRRPRAAGRRGRRHRGPAAPARTSACPSRASAPPAPSRAPGGGPAPPHRPAGRAAGP